MPRLAPEGPGARPRAHAMASPRGEEGLAGEGALRGRGRPGQSAVRGRGLEVKPHQGRGPGPHPRPRTAPRGRAGKQARGSGRAPVGGIQRWAWSGCSGDAGDGSPAPARGEPRDPEVHFRGHRSLASGAAVAPLLPEPAQGEAGRRSREPPACSGACARKTQLGPGKGKPGGMNAQAQEGGGAIRSREALWACAESKSKGRESKR